MQSVTLLLPATDETFSLKETVRQAQLHLPDRDIQFLIITSSKLTTPECRKTIKSLQNEYGAQISTFDQTRSGIGGALQDAIDRATKDITVIMASDLETDPTLLPALIAGIEGGSDIAVTSRWRGGARFSGYDPLKLFLNRGFQLLFRLLYWTDLTDLTYAYRAYKTPVLKSIRWEESKFPFLFESILKPLRLRYRVAEIEAPWRARREGVSHNSFGQTFDYVRVGLKVRFMPVRSMRSD